MKKSTALSISMTPNEQRLGLVYLLLSLVLIPGAVTRTARLLVPDISAAAQNFAYFLFNFLCICVIFRRFLWRSVRAAGKNLLRTVTAVVIGLLAQMQIFLLLALWTRRTAPDFSNVNDASIENLASQNYPLMAIGTVFLAPVAEEVLYRGIVFGSLSKKSTAAACLISTLVFCAIHVVNYIGLYDPSVLLLCFVQYIPAGICLSLSYWWADNIFAPILIHAIFNAMGILSMR